MTGLVDWAASRARMVLAFIVLSLAVGTLAYVTLPKEGEPDIEIPALIISLPFQGISAEDSEKLLIKPMETELADLDGLKKMTSTAVDNYANLVLEFEFGWDKTKIIADVRDRMNTAEANFPSGADKYSINEFNFSEFPIIIVSLSGEVPERTLLKLAQNLQDRLEGLEPVLSATLAGHRDEMVEVIIDPLKLEAYNVTAGELINVVVNNNQLIPAGSADSATSSFAVKIPSSFNETQDIYNLPVKTNGDRVVTLGDLATIGLTFEDREGTARFNGETTVALQVVKRKGFNLIDTAALVVDEVEKERKLWPTELQNAVTVTSSNDQSRQVDSMVNQLEGSVITAIALVMIVVLAALGIRPALLVGFAIPTSFLLCFALLALMGITISNIVMFGLILAVGMLVDGAIVVVEYADKRIRDGAGPMEAYTDAAKRMFWPIVSSTATTLCAFLPMLFWPGVPGQFMGMLPVTLIFVLSASLVVALIYLPVLGGVTAGIAKFLNDRTTWIANAKFYQHILLAIGALVLMALAAAVLGMVQTGFGLVSTNFDGSSIGTVLGTVVPAMLAWTALALLGVLGFAFLVVGVGVLFLALAAIFPRVGNALRTGMRMILPRREKKIQTQRQRTPFGYFVQFLTGNPVMPLAVVFFVVAFVGATFIYFGSNNKGVEFFVETEPEQAIVYVRARGNMSLEEKDKLLRQAEDIILSQPGVQSTFAFAGEGGLNANTGGAGAPLDTIGQAQIELVPWEDRPTIDTDTKIFGFIPWTTSEQDEALDGNTIINQLQTRLDVLPGIKTEILNLAMGPASAKPVHLRIKGDNWEDLLAGTALARKQFESTFGLSSIEDTLPLPGIDWQINVDVEKAGRYGADVATVGAMVQLVTRGIFLDTMRVPSSEEEVEIRVRLPKEDRVLSTLDSLKVRTPSGLVPLSNFITREPIAKLGMINRIDQTRYFDVKAAVTPDLTETVVDENGDEQEVIVNPATRVAKLTEWLETNPLPAGLEWEWTGDQEDEAESQAFLSQAFMGALGLMFIILLAQFNSVYNSVLVLLAVVLSTTGVLIGMLVMGQAFSIIMTGTGIVALAGIVVNNNIVLIDTYQDYGRYMPKVEAIVRTAEDRIRPVLLTTITTMAGLAPMMFGLSLDFFGGGYTLNSPTSLWWKQLATAVVFGLGIATVLTLLFTPSMLALRVWATTYAIWVARLLARLSMGRASKAARDWALRRQSKSSMGQEIIWDFDSPKPTLANTSPLKAAE